MPKAGTVKLKGGKNADYYEISMRQIMQQILPAGLPATTVWGYGAVKSASKKGLLLHNAPSLTIEANAGTPVRVKWINDLKDANGNYLPHLLPVDPTLHWANPPGGTGGRDTRPTFTITPGAYSGPVPMVTARPRFGWCGRRERRLRRSLVPARGQRHSCRLCDEGHLVRLLRRQGRRKFGGSMGTGFCDVPVPEHAASLHHLVS